MSLVPVTAQRDMQKGASNNSEPLKILLPGISAIEIEDNFGNQAMKVQENIDSERFIGYLKRVHDVSKCIEH